VSRGCKVAEYYAGPCVGSNPIVFPIQDTIKYKILAVWIKEAWLESILAIKEMAIKEMAIKEMAIKEMAIKERDWFAVLS
jgi:hypothetical protein